MINSRLESGCCVGVLRRCSKAENGNGVLLCRHIVEMSMERVFLENGHNKNENYTGSFSCTVQHQ